MNHDKEGFASRISGYLVQQDVEKELKAWLAHVGQSYPCPYGLS